MEAKRLENGNLLVPMRAEDNGTVGDGMIEVTPDNPLYRQWQDWYNQQGKDLPEEK